MSDEIRRKKSPVTEMVFRAFGPVRHIDTTTLVADDFKVTVGANRRLELENELRASRDRLLAED